MKSAATNSKRERGDVRFIVTKLTVSAYIHQIESDPKNENNLGTRNNHDCSTETWL